MECCIPSPPSLRHRQRVRFILPFYIVSILGSGWLLRHEHPAAWLSVLLAIVPALPLVAMVAAAAAYLREEGDEFLRSLFIERMLWSVAAILLISSVWGLLEVLDSTPRLPIFYVFPAFWFFFGVAGPVVRMRYGKPEVND